MPFRPLAGSVLGTAWSTQAYLQQVEGEPEGVGGGRGLRGVVQEGEEKHQGSFPQGALACLGRSPGSHQKAQGLVWEPQHAGCSSDSLSWPGRVCEGASIKRKVALGSCVNQAEDRKHGSETA